MSLTITNENNMALMARYPDGYFDYGILDPPYGLNIDGQKLNNTNKNPKHNRKEHVKKSWDNQIPSATYWSEVRRVCKHLIVFGGNYFTEYLPPVKGWLIWYKGQQDLTMSDAEMIWTDLPIVTRVITINRAELIKQNTVHPTEKPYKIYKHILSKYCTQGSHILDTHIGSGSIAIACHDYGFDLTGAELDPDYYEAAMKRINAHISQGRLFV